MEDRGLEPNSVSDCPESTYEDDAVPFGTECGTVGDDSAQIPPELAAVWGTLTDNQRRKILDILKAQRTSTAE